MIGASIFQFLYGTIKTPKVIVLSDYKTLNFNSCMVRLRPTRIISISLLRCNFNSCMVRLRLRCNKAIIFICFRFQFLYGTIKTSCFSFLTIDVTEFQFLYGTIKTGHASRLYSQCSSRFPIPQRYKNCSIKMSI